jgi:hypothetical protein
MVNRWLAPTGSAASSSAAGRASGVTVTDDVYHVPALRIIGCEVPTDGIWSSATFGGRPACRAAPAARESSTARVSAAVSRCPTRYQLAKA